MREEKTLNVSIWKDNHDFIGELRDYLTDMEDGGNFTQAHVVNILLSQARMKFKAEKKFKVNS